MADNSLFGTVDPMMTPAEANQRRYNDLREADRPFFEAEYEAAAQDTNPSMRRRSMNQAQGRHNRRVQEQAKVQTQEQKKAQFGAELTSRMNADPRFNPTSPAYIGAERIREESLKYASEVAGNLGMRDVQQQYADQYVSTLKDRLKAEAEQEKLGYQTEKARKESQVAGRRTFEQRDRSGNLVEYDEDADGKLSAPRVKEYATWEMVKWGDDDYRLKNSGTGEVKDFGYKDEQAVKADLQRRNDFAQAAKTADAELAKLDRASNLVNKWSTGFIGKSLVELGSLSDELGGYARALMSELNSIKSSLGFDQLKALREKGSTLGQVAVIELEMLQSTLTNLDQWARPEDVRQSLEIARQHYENFKLAMQNDQAVRGIDYNDPRYDRWVGELNGRRFLRDPDNGGKPSVWID